MSKNLRPERARSFAARFVKNGFIATQAVLELGWTDNYMSAAVTGHRLLNNDKVKQAEEEHIKKAKMSADEVLEELSSVAKSNPAIDGNQKMKALEMLAKAHNLVDKRAEQPRESNRDNQLLQARQSYILTALPELARINPDWPVERLQTEAEAKFTAWMESLNLSPLITEQVQ